MRTVISKVEKKFGMTGRMGGSQLFLLSCWMLFIPWSTLWWQGPASLRGRVTDPSVGAGAADVYIDGFTKGDMPPKSAIREIRVNANPFSAENDRLGYGRVDVFTKPGNAAFHGDLSSEYNDSSM